MYIALYYYTVLFNEYDEKNVVHTRSVKRLFFSRISSIWGWLNQQMQNLQVQNL